MEIHKKEISARELSEDIRDDLEVMASGAGVTLQMNTILPENSPKADSIRTNGVLSEQAVKADRNTCGKEVGKIATESINKIGRSVSKNIGRSGGIMSYGCVKTDDEIWDEIINVDTVILHRILENIFENATRFAQNTISVEFMLREHVLQITVTDDGKGFSDEILRKRQKNFLPTQQQGHLGMGLAISRVLCEKYGGSMQLLNAVPHGGVVKIHISVNLSQAADIEGSKAVLYRANLDGTGREKVYTFDASLALEDIVLGDENGIYVVEKKLTAEQGDIGTYFNSTERKLVYLDPEAAKEQEICSLDFEGFICGKFFSLSALCLD